MRSSDGRKLRLLTTAGRIALLAAENTEEEMMAGRHDLPAEIRRCDLDAACWLPSWRIGPATDDDAVVGPNDDGPVLGGASAHGRTVVVLTYDKPSRFTRTLPPRRIIAASYSITCYQSDGLNPRWSKTLPGKPAGGEPLPRCIDNEGCDLHYGIWTARLGKGSIIL